MTVCACDECGAADIDCVCPAWEDEPCEVCDECMCLGCDPASDD